MKRLRELMYERRFSAINSFVFSVVD
jgi:hypothetical protein